MRPASVLKHNLRTVALLLTLATAVANPASAGNTVKLQHTNLPPTPNYTGRLNAVAEWRCDQTNILLTIEVEDPAIAPPWRGVRDGDHVSIVLSNSSHQAELVFPAPSYAENQLLPLAGLPPTQLPGDRLTPTQISKAEGTVLLAFDTGRAAMAIENASEIRLEWHQTTGGLANVTIGAFTERIPRCRQPDALCAANLWEPLKALSEQQQTSITLTLPNDAKMQSTPPPQLTIVPDRGRKHPIATVTGRRTKDTYSATLRAHIKELGFTSPPSEIRITVYDARLSDKPITAASATLTLPIQPNRAQ